MDVQPLELKSELVDWLTEAVVLPRDPALRSDHICHLVEVIVDAVGWRADDTGDPTELLSAARILQAAQDHQLQMRLTSGLSPTGQPPVAAA